MHADGKIGTSAQTPPCYYKDCLRGVGGGSGGGGFSPALSMVSWEEQREELIAASGSPEYLQGGLSKLRGGFCKYSADDPTQNVQHLQSFVHTLFTPGRIGEFPVPAVTLRIGKELFFMQK